jgi:hypothetical protein
MLLHIELLLQIDTFKNISALGDWNWGFILQLGDAMKTVSWISCIPNYALWLFLFCTTLEWLWWIKFPLENFCTLAPYELVLGIFCFVCCLTRMACTSTSNQLSWGLTYFANDDIILSMPRTDDLELVLRYWNFVSYSVCFLCSKLKVNRGATDIWGQWVEYYIIWSPF